ncbi:MAG: N4-gp56 family major capsid protein [Pseudomonadota bacterium]
MATNTTGDISYRTAGYVSREMLKRGQPLLIVSRLGSSKPIPRNSSKTIKFRGYLPLSNTPKALTEGVTPTPSDIEFVDIVANLVQYGDHVELTDVLHDTHEDPLIPEFSGILGEQSAQMIENVTISKLLAGTNVIFNGATSAGVLATDRDDVNKPISRALQRRALRALKRQNAMPITSVVKASANFATSPVPASYIAVCSTDLESDIRDMEGFIPVEKYASGSGMEGEIGSVEGVRYLTTTMMTPFEDAGGTPLSGTDVVSTSGSVADVYPVFIFGKDAFGVTPFAKAANGASPVTPMVLNPNVPRGGDPLGQRGTIGWKLLHTAEILHDFWMIRLEVAASEL